MNNRLKAFVVAAILVVTIGCSTTSPQREPADLILRNGAIYTVDAANPWVEAVAVRDGRYVARGTNAEIARRFGASQVIDLQGRMAMPGIFDAHIHPILAGTKALYECVFRIHGQPRRHR